MKELSSEQTTLHARSDRSSNFVVTNHHSGTRPGNSEAGPKPKTGAEPADYSGQSAVRDFEISGRKED
jgi:hypothetical protein